MAGAMNRMYGAATMVGKDERNGRINPALEADDDVPGEIWDGVKVPVKLKFINKQPESFFIAIEAQKQMQKMAVSSAAAAINSDLQQSGSTAF